MRSVFMAVLLNGIAPLLYLLVFQFGLGEYQSAAQSAGYTDVFEACRYIGGSSSGDCEELNFLLGAKWVAIAAIAAGTVVPFLLYLVPTILGRSRITLGLFFPLALPFALLATLAISISSIVFVGLAAHVLTTWTFHVIWPYLYIVLGLGGLFLLLVTLSAFGTVFSATANREFGHLLDKHQLPDVWEMLEDLARQLKVRRPKNVIVGVSPTFYITNAKTEILPSKKIVSGETLYLSATLCRLLTPDELKSIIAHELMHYKGKDLTYTRIFFPIYRLLASMIQQLSNSENAAGLPLLANLQPLYAGFTQSERRISRQRELAADAGAAKVTQPIALANALAKVSIFSSTWDLALRDNSNALRIAEYTGNAPDALLGYAVYECSNDFVDEQFHSLLSKRLSHPTDTHPTMQDRFDNLGVTLSEITRTYFDTHNEVPDALVIEGEGITDQIGIAFLYETLSQYPVTLPPEDDAEAKNERAAYRLLYQIITHFIRADGLTLPEEVKAAEAVGRRHFPDFNPLIFREYVHGTSELLPLDRLAEFSVSIFNENGIESIRQILHEVVMADGEAHPDEQVLLHDYLSNVEKHVAATAVQ